MKAAYQFLATLFILYAPAAIAEHATITLPESGKNISLNFQPAPNNAGNFRAIKIESADKIVTFIPKNPIARIPANDNEELSTGIWRKVSGLKLDSSHVFFRGGYTSNGQPHTLLFFVSEPGGSDASALFVIGFSYVGEPHKVLALDNLDLVSFQQAGDNTALIIGKRSVTQVMAGEGGNGSKAPYATTYDPYSVFIVHIEGTAVYSLAASRRYNQEHYVWAGPHSREDYAVFYNVPEHPKPFGAPASHIDAMLGNAKVPNIR